MRKTYLAVVAGFLVLSLVLACGGPEEKKAKFFGKAKELFERGDLVKARLEAKNALQIDPKFAEGYRLLGQIEMQAGDFKAAYGAFGKAVELKPELLAAQIELGKLMLMSGAADKAMEKAETVLAQEPAHPEALMLKGSALLAQREFEPSVKVFEGLLQKGVKKPEVFLALATAQAQGHHLAQAEKTLKEGIAANKDSVPLNLGLAKFYSDAKQPENAVAAMRKVIELQPDQPMHKFSLASLLWDDGRQAAAIGMVTELLAKDPANEEMRETAARFYLSKNQLLEASKVLEAGVEQAPKSFKLRLLLGEVYLNQNQPQKAVATLEDCLKLSADPANPGIIQAKTLLARVHLLLRQTDKAEAYTSEVLKDNPRSIDAHLTRGDIFLVKGDGVSAAAEFRTVVNERPQFIPGHLRLAGAHVLNQELDLAVSVLQNALRIDPKSKEALQTLAQVYALKKNHPAAEEQLRKIVDLYPGEPGARAGLGDFLASIHKTAEAREAYRTIIQRDPQNPLGYLKLSRLYRFEKKPQEALAVLEEGYRQNQVSGELLSALIQSYLQQKRHDAAIGVCRKRIAQNPQDVFAFNLLGWIYTDLKNYQEAEGALKKAIEMQPLWPAPHTNLANLYLLQGRKAEAAANFEAAINANPRDPAGYLSLALLHERDKDYGNAITVYERALRENPGFWFAANNLAFLLAETSTQTEDLGRAKALAEEAIKQRPNEPALIDTLGWVYFRMGDYGQARGLIEQALAGAPEAEVLNYHMAAALLKLGQKDAAREKLKKALEGSGDYPGRADAERMMNELG
jgi:tetratricopeptide (TPR) repeat protein